MRRRSRGGPRARGAAVRLAAAAAAWCVLAQAGWAQSWPQFTSWTQSPLRLNPASAANLYSLDASVAYRRQWSNLEGAPETTQVTVGAPVYIANAGVSLGFERDEAGLTRSNLLRASASYRLVERESFALSVGAGVGYRDASLDGAALRTETGRYADPNVPVHNDPLLAASERSGAALGFDLGVEVEFGDTRVGASVLDANAPVSDWAGVERAWPRTVVAYATGLYPVAEYIDLEAGLLAYSDLGATQAQASVTGWYGGNIGLGASLRGFSNATLDAVSLLVGWRPSNTLTLAYSFDYGLSDLSRAHDGSHEVVLRYVMATPIGKGKLPPVIFNPRL